MDKKKISALIGVVATVALVGGAFAYFSGTAEQKQNAFSVVAGEQDEDGAIEIDEPGWVPEDAEDLEPGQIVTKDPSVKSNVDYDGWIIVKVTSPKIEASMTKDGAASKLEAFDYLGLSSDYELLKTEDGDDAVVYYYGYKNILTAGGQTSALFNKIQLKDFARIDAAQEGSVDVDAAIVQKINPSSGAEFENVGAAFTALGSSFTAGDANLQ